MPPKVRVYDTAEELLAKLDGRAAMWHRVARENEERAQEFDEAAKQIRAGESTVTVGRTTYRISDTHHTE